MVAISLSKVFNPTHRAIHSLGENYARKRLVDYLNSLPHSTEEEFAKLSSQKITGILSHAASTFENFSPSHFEFYDQFLGCLFAQSDSLYYKASLKLFNAIGALAAQ
jgi:hypothetical protein